MNVEVLRPENTCYLEQYETLGFGSMNDMVEVAIEMLRDKFECFPQLSEGQLQRIQNAKMDFNRGSYLTNSQADNIVDEWLKR